MSYSVITEEDLQVAISKSHNWKTPGIDNIQNYWYKKFTCTHTRIAKCLTEIVQNPEKMPHFLTKGITYLKPKSANTADPTQYRPITCLPTLYKILTSCITNKITNHLEQYINRTTKRMQEKSYGL